MSEEVKSYNEINSKKKYFDFLTKKIIKNIKDFVELEETYEDLLKKFKNNDDEYILEKSCSQLKDYYWNTFCIRMREYSNIVYKIIKNNPSKYQQIEIFINKSKFIKQFYEHYRAMNQVVHAYNENDKDFDNLFEINNKNYSFKEKGAIHFAYKNFNEVEHEFIEIIKKFREIEQIECEESYLKELKSYLYNDPIRSLFLLLLDEEN
ncbi:MAG: hypothetical protein ACRDAW_01345 [Metamycoplasmataceae bacterium]